MMRTTHRIGLYWRTLRHLRPIQIANRIHRRLFQPKNISSSACPLRHLVSSAKAFVDRPVSILGESQFVFLNEDKQLLLPGDWNNIGIPKLWLYNLHYFDGLLCPQTPAALKEAVIVRWLQDNPPGWGGGWDPYPLSLRIVNWIKWSLSGGSLSVDAIQSLAIQARYLRATLEYHLLGNHLFANAKALVFVGCYFDGNDAERWLRKGLKILRNQINEQFLPDGGHFELSTTYHASLTEDLLDLINIMRTVSMPIPSEWIEAAEKVLSWLSIMTRPDGLPPLFNDAAYRITLSCSELINYANRLGFRQPAAVSSGMNDLPNSGYFRYEEKKYSFFGDIGPIGPDYIPGHGHCDILNFELYARGRPLIVDTGTSTYEVGDRRLSERGTAAHNTVQIGDIEQSEIWASFRVGRRARLIERHVSPSHAVGSYRVPGGKGYIHHRRFEFNAEKIIIDDEMKRTSNRMAFARLHFHPDAAPELDIGEIVAGDVRIRVSGSDRIAIEDYYYAPEFNKRIPAKVAVITFRKSLKTEIIV